MNQKDIRTIDLKYISYSHSTKRFLYKEKPFIFTTPWLSCKQFQDNQISLKIHSGYEKNLNTILETIKEMSNYTGSPNIYTFKFSKYIGFFDYKLQKEIELSELDYEKIFNNNFCSVKLQLKIDGVSKNNDLIIRLENCAFKTKEIVDFQSSSELEDE